MALAKKIAKTDACVLKMIVNQSEFILASYGFNTKLLRIKISVEFWQHDNELDYGATIYYQDSNRSREMFGKSTLLFLHETFANYKELLAYIEKQVKNISDTDMANYKLAEIDAPAT